MDKITWKNKQDGTTTPLNAENLNLMQDNIETAINLKANTSYVNTELNKKSTLSYVYTELNKKANLTYVNEELEEKMDNIIITTSTSNGVRQAIKYPDGALICSWRSDLIQEAVNTAQGSLYQSDSLSMTSYLVGFNSPPAVTFSITQNITTGTMFFCASNAASGTASNPPTQRIISTKSTGKPSGVAGYYISYVAIGRWK